MYHILVIICVHCTHTHTYHLLLLVADVVSSQTVLICAVAERVNIVTITTCNTYVHRKWQRFNDTILRCNDYYVFICLSYLCVSFVILQCICRFICFISPCIVAHNTQFLIEKHLFFLSLSFSTSNSHFFFTMYHYQILLI